MTRFRWLFTMLLFAGVLGANASPADSHDDAAKVKTSDASVARGKYLVAFGGCNDCHTPGYFLGKPDATRYLGGSDVGIQVPGLGTFIGRNLTPDKQTGLGDWTDEQIGLALTSGIARDGRTLSPLMPWPAFSKLTKRDVRAIVAYLRTLPPVKHEVHLPFGPNETPQMSVLRLVPYSAAIAGGSH